MKLAQFVIFFDTLSWNSLLDIKMFLCLRYKLPMIQAIFSCFVGKY